MKVEKSKKFAPIQPLVNKVQQSDLVTINLEQYYPQDTLHEFDLKDYLFRGMILREKDFRQAVKDHDWSRYQDGVLLVFNSADAIIPMWAYMLIGVASSDFAKTVFHGAKEEYIDAYYRDFLAKFDVSPHKDGKIILKGCGKKPVPPSAYMELTRRLKPHVQSIMFGEPCSTVPIYKRKK
ncbi:MAG TPA: DUF2480 family protein [Saprospiraceae bacterium]|nr:DUF2480 family protein [Saprospiraceae bacterium]